MSSAPFSDDAVPLSLLRELAFNSRWAEQPADVIPLTAADPDFTICPAIQEQLARHVRDGVLTYSPPEGLPRFREAVADWMRTAHQVDCTADAIFATTGATAAMVVGAHTILNDGDEVLIPDPDFLFQPIISSAGATPIRINVNPATTADEFIAGMRARLTPRTRMLWLCNPHNPLGVVYSREWLQDVAEWAIEHGLRILSDEIWSDIVYVPHHHISLASIAPEIASNTLTVYGFSKSYGLAGLRVGCLVCTSPEWQARIAALSGSSRLAFNVSVLSQIAAIAALRDGQQWLSELVLHLHNQRDYVLERLLQWPGVTVHPPQGTYVVFPCVRFLSDDIEHLCEHLRDRARVALVPGSPHWFGPGANGHLRISFATSRRILQTAFDRLEPVVQNLANENA